MPNRKVGARSEPTRTRVEIDIAARVRILRGTRVMLDSDLAALYRVTTKVLNQSVGRNRGRFPDDFMFRISEDEYETLRSQFVTSKPERRGGRRYRPYAFTELGVAMLSSVLKSERAIAVNILIMRAFVRLRAALGETLELRTQIADVERRLDEHGEILGNIIQAIDALAGPTATQAIGFRVPRASPPDDTTQRRLRSPTK